MPKKKIILVVSHRKSEPALVTLEMKDGRVLLTELKFQKHFATDGHGFTRIK